MHNIERLFNKIRCSAKLALLKCFDWPQLRGILECLQMRCLSNIAFFRPSNAANRAPPPLTGRMLKRGMGWRRWGGKIVKAILKAILRSHIVDIFYLGRENVILIPKERILALYRSIHNSSRTVARYEHVSVGDDCSIPV